MVFMLSLLIRLVLVVNDASRCSATLDGRLRVIIGFIPRKLKRRYSDVFMEEKTSQQVANLC